jgi:hypothetical protein
MNLSPARNIQKITMLGEVFKGAKCWHKIKKVVYYDRATKGGCKLRS